MTIVTILEILPHIVSKFFSESCSCVTMLCGVLWVIVIVSRVVVFKWRVIVFRGNVRGVMNSNKIV